ncbi:MAG: PQQ-like beta-propeller repeat protein [Phycisphaerae bacterium]|nr:PQQ-like beta-propeller repeat protein [Phycisphaerae bacterium]
MKVGTMISLVCIAGMVLSVSASGASAGNWPRFRGPNGQGVSAEPGIPVTWTPQDMAWTLELPGSGHSSPVIQDRTIFITCADKAASKLTLMAVALSDGEVLWSQSFTVKPLKVNGLNSAASSTPAVDENGVYAVWYGADETQVVAFDRQGQKKWTRDLGPTETRHGPASSPMVYDDLVVLALEQGTNTKGLKSFWYGLDRRTGEDRWRLERSISGNASASTPCVYKSDSGKNMLIFTSRDHGITAVDPEQGTVIWEQTDAMRARVVSSPVLAGDQIIGTCGQGGGGVQLTVVRVPDSATAKPKILHAIREKYVPYVPTSIVANHRLFTFHDQGTVSCLDIETGAVLWSQKPGGTFYGSPVLVEDRLYCVNRKGQVVVLRASDTYELLAINELGEASQSTPAIANGCMILRTESRLLCLTGDQAK